MHPSLAAASGSTHEILAPTTRAPPPPPFPPCTQVRVPLGLAAELLRAGCIAASAETALALISSATAAPQQQHEALTFVDGSGTTAAFLSPLLLDLLRVLACASAGAAVSCVGGGGSGSGSGSGSGGEKRGRGRSNPGAVAASATTTSGLPVAPPEAAGSVGRGDHQEAVGGDASEALPPTRPAAPAWFVPSGALGGAFYALTAGGVFEGAMRVYLLGESWSRVRAWQK